MPAWPGGVSVGQPVVQAGADTAGMVAPLVIGLFHATVCRVWAMESRRARAVAAEAALQGAAFGLFGTTDVDFESGTVRYMRITPAGWLPWRGPMPDVVLRAASMPGEAEWPDIGRLRALAPVASWSLPDKTAVATALQATGLAAHVIPFCPVEGPDAQALIASFLDRHRRAVLKPVSANSGRGVTFIACDGGDIVVRQNSHRWRLPREQGLAELAGLVGSRRWIIQRLIVSRVRDGRVFDIRVHAHKDGRGRWTLVRSYVRLSEAGLLVSNTSRGGYQGDLHIFAGQIGDRGAALAATVQRLGLRIAGTLDDIYGGRLDEIGADILVDPQMHPWIAEVNSGPVSRLHEFERARLHVAYALHLARRFKDGQAHGHGHGAVVAGERAGC